MFFAYTIPTILYAFKSNQALRCANQTDITNPHHLKAGPIGARFGFVGSSPYENRCLFLLEDALDGGHQIIPALLLNAEPNDGAAANGGR